MRLIAVDLDGTLLDSQHQIPPENRKAIRRLAKSGFKIVIATGRSVVSVREIVQELGVEAYILALNGTYIAEIDKEQRLVPLRRKVIDKNVLIEAFKLAKAFQVTCIASNEHYSDRVVFDDGRELVQEFLVKRPDLRVLTEREMTIKLMDATTEYLKAGFTSQDLSQLTRLKQAMAEKGIDTIFSDKHYIEVVPEGVNKGDALSFICDYLGVPIENSIAFGDQENDLEMLQVAGVGVAMGNASDHVKAVADAMTDNNANFGVAKYIEDFL